MKISQIMLAKNFGGAERYFVDLSNELVNRGHDVQSIYHRKFIAPDALKENDRLRKDPVNVIGNWDIFAVNNIKKLIREFSPDIIHAHLARAALYGGRVACGSPSLPLVVKTHNYIKLKYYRRVNKFITTTEDQKRYLICSGVNEKSIEVIPNFSAVHSTEHRAAKNNTTRFVIVAYGRMVQKKGFGLLLTSIRQVIDRGHDVELKLGGDGPEKNRLLRICEDLKLNDNVTFAGWVEDVNELLRQADLFVLPSLDEPFGIALLEAMANSVPVVSTRTQGPTEILDDQTAWLVNINDAEDLAEKICLAIISREENRQRAENALAVFRKKYAADSVVPRIVELYKNLISSY